MIAKKELIKPSMKPKVSQTIKPPHKQKSHILIQNTDSTLKDLSIEKPKDNVSIAQEMKKQQITKQTSIIIKPSLNDPLQKPIITKPILKTKIPTIKKEETNIPSRTSISSSKSMRTSSLVTQAPNIIKQTQPQDGQEKQILKTIIINIKQFNDVNNKLKDLEGLNKVTTEKVTLILNTRFESDKDLIQFSLVMTKVASKVMFLEWNLSGSFTDDGSARWIGDILSRFKKAYSIKLKIEAEYFADTGAASLANALKNLKSSLKVLKLQIFTYLYKIAKKLTEVGINKIKTSIKMLQNLELLEYNGMEWDSLSELNNLSNFVYEIPFYYKVEQLELQKLLDRFNKKMDLIGNKLVKLELLNYDDFEIYIGDEIIDFEQYYLIYSNILKIIKDLPYLTSFSDQKLIHQDYKAKSHEETQNKELQQYKYILQDLFQERSLVVMKTKVFNNNIIQSLTINPAMVLTDLYIP